MNPLQQLEDWEILLSFLPAGWVEKAIELGALARKRKIDSAETLLRLLLIHLADGKSLRTTAAYSKDCTFPPSALYLRDIVLTKNT